jgi:DNA-binding CsgD family transcriptional regulator
MDERVARDRMNSGEVEILDELRQIKGLLSLIATQGLKQRDQISALARVGFTPKQIAELLGTTANTVSVYLSEIRKQKKKARGGAKQDFQENGSGR